MKPWNKKLLKDLQGHRWLRSTSEWVIRRTNSKTVTAWLVIDLLISIGLAVYYGIFKYVSSLGWAPFQFMLNYKFLIIIASLRAACTLWGIFAVLSRNVKQVKLFYTVFIFNLFVAAWLMTPVLSLDCRCSNYYQCEALQSFALDGRSLNMFPQPAHFRDRKVPYEVEPKIKEELLDAPEHEDNEARTSEAKAADPVTGKAATEPVQPQAAATEPVQPKAAATEPVQPKAAATEPVQPKAAATEPVQPKAAATEPVQAQAAATEPVQPKATATEHVQPKAAATEPVQAQAAATEPVQAQAAATEPVQAQAAATEPVQAQAAATEPVQAQAAATEPVQPKVQQAPEEGVQAAKELADITQKQADSKPEALIQRLEKAERKEEQGYMDNESLDSLLGHRMVPKKRHRTEASLLQIESTFSGPDSDKSSKPDADASNAKDEKLSKDALDLRSEKELKVLSYFDPVGNAAKLVSERGDEGMMCEHNEKKLEEWDLDNSRMQDMMEGKNLEEHDASFIKTIHACIAEEACAGIFWKVFQNENGETYNSTACTLIGPVSFPNKDQSEETSGHYHSLFFRKNVPAVKDLVREQQRKAKVMSKIFNAQTDAQAVEYTHRLYSNMCRCDDKGCRSFAQSEGSEVGWCYINDKTRHFCTAAEKQVFLDPEDKPWTRQICHEAETYERSCKCSGIGMLPPFGLKVDADLVSSEPNNYGSGCQKWGQDDQFKWCFVGWDSGCVDRRRTESSLNRKYKDADTVVPPQYWSELACDTAEPNPRLLAAADSCENLEYLADGVCLLHLALTLPMIMVLYNYISNQCGDDIMMVQQFAVDSSSDDDDEGKESRRQSAAESKEATAKEGDS